MSGFIEMAEYIKKTRILQGYTQADVSELSGVSLRTIRDMEKGSSQSSLANWAKVLDVLGLAFRLKAKDITNAQG
jgi:transcriptional regulator with XRE-family HTH domain